MQVVSLMEVEGQSSNKLWHNGLKLELSLQLKLIQIQFIQKNEFKLQTAYPGSVWLVFTVML